MNYPRVTCDDVNALVAICSLSQEKAITSLKQCSSSLFVLLYQRLFNCALKGIDSSPYTLEQKKWNVRCLLNELHDKRGIDVAGIDAEQIVQLNEEHISRLIMVFLNIAQSINLQGGSMSPQLRQPPSPAARPVLAELPQGLAEGGAWYVPVAPADHHHIDEEDENEVEDEDLVGLHGLDDDPLKAAAERVLQHARAPPPPPPQRPRGDAVKADESAPGPRVAYGPFSDEHDGGSDGSYGAADDDGDAGAIPTTQLVQAWNAEVIPPAGRARVLEAADLRGVRRRLAGMDERLARAERAGRPRRAAQEVMPPPALASLVPDTVPSGEALVRRPKRNIDYTLRDEKIELLRSIRFIDDLQKDIRRRMVQRHSDRTRQLHDDVRRAIQQDQQEKLELKRRTKEADQKYRNAYTVMFESACNDLRVSRELMRGRTRQLAEYQSQALRESRRMCQYMKRENRELLYNDVVRYASAVTKWQSDFVS